MGLYSSMRTSASGMNAQSNRISSVADNIANSNTAGYKRSAVEFSTLVLAQGGADYQSGSVNSATQYYVSQQGAMLPTSRWSNAGIQGDGFFVVQDAGGQTFFTRAGSFVPTEGDGFLENAAGMRLMGYPLSGGAIPPVVINGTAGLEQIRLSTLALASSPSTSGKYAANLPTNLGTGGTATPTVAANSPADNVAASTSSVPVKSMVVFDNLGNEVTLDIYATRIPNAGASPVTDQWEITVFNAADRNSGASFFPYGASGSAPLSSVTASFNSTGNLVGGVTSASFTVPGGQAFTLDLSQVSANSAEYSPEVSANGNAPSQVTSYEISEDGVLSAIYENGARVETYKIPLAKVPSPDKLIVQPGNTFSTSKESGDFQIGFANEGGRGEFVGGALEQSNVDLANELTNMIEAQRNYTANSKVFQTSAELMDVLVNLQR